MKNANLIEKIPVEAMKRQIQATVLHSIYSKKNVLGTYINEFQKLKNVEKIPMSEFLEWIVDYIPQSTTYNIVKGKIVFKVLPAFGTEATKSELFEEESDFEF